MAQKNVEIKARVKDPEAIRQYLLSHEAIFAGTDHQTDTYFNTQQGRLKLREGNIENNLIGYERNDQAGPKTSVFTLTRIPDAPAFKSIMSKTIGIKVIVNKIRDIYFIGNVKFHIDRVEGLGSFMEIEAGNLRDASKSEEDLQTQCRFYLRELGIAEKDLLTNSYSDMLSVH
ncbi:MAG: CYTH domain-containing protein [Terrimonas sp.]|nr:CYTH domain-containing protein [Terrimonas sp.]